MHRVAAVLIAVASGWASGGATLHAQSSWLSGYIQTAPLFSGETELAPSNVSDFNRFRLSIDPDLGPFSVEVAYEHAVSFRQRDVTPGFGLGGVQGGAEWWKLQGTITSSDQEHVVWVHRFDRLNVGVSPADAVDLRVGRQTISWGTTAFLSPADPFVPFIPADPFRLYRAGVDAVRVRMYPGPLSEIDLVVRPTDTDVGEEVTALGRGLTTVQNWELSGWGGTLYGDIAGAFGAAGGFGAWAVRTEAVIREIDGTIIGRGTIGIDRAFFFANGRTLAVGWEYQRDGLGAASPSDYLGILRSPEFRRGEFQVIGRDETVFNGSYQLSPLWTAGSFVLWNLNDDSVLVAPSVAYNAGDNTSVTSGLFFGFGDTEITAARPLPSEYGLAGFTGYVSLSWFF
jgi:hypothetical protein